MADTFPCQGCGKPIQIMPGLKPGDQFMVNCPSCGLQHCGRIAYLAEPNPFQPQAISK